MDINLLPEDAKPEEVKIEKSNPAISFKAVIIVSSILVVALLSIIAPRMYLKYVDVRLSLVEKQLSSQEYSQVRQVESDISTVNGSIETKRNIIRAIDTQGYPVADTLNIVAKSAPKGCIINSFNYTSSQINVSGIANSSLQAGEFLLNMERLGSFSSLNNLDSASLEKNSQKYKFNFTFAIGGKGGK